MFDDEGYLVMTRDSRGVLKKGCVYPYKRENGVVTIQSSQGLLYAYATGTTEPFRGIAYKALKGADWYKGSSIEVGKTYPEETLVALGFNPAYYPAYWKKIDCRIGGGTLKESIGAIISRDFRQAHACFSSLKSQEEKAVFHPAEEDLSNPSHYKLFSVESIDMMVRIWGPEKVAVFCELNAFKYKMRVGDKAGQPVDLDLKKAKWYLDKAAELRKEGS